MWDVKKLPHHRGILENKIRKCNVETIHCLSIYTQRIVSNSHFLVLNSEHVHRTIHGYFTNWNSTGYFEFSTSSRKWSLEDLENQRRGITWSCDE